MADLTITVANVLPGVVSGMTVNKASGIAAGTLTAGQSIYLDASNSNKVTAADANASALTAVCAGVTLHGALAGQPITYISGGPLALGAILTAGLWYVVSATAGGIAPVADLTTGWYSTRLGYAYSTTVLIIDINVTGVPLA